MDQTERFAFNHLKRRVDEMDKLRVEAVRVVDQLTARLTEAEIQIKEIKGGGPLPRHVPGT